MKKVEAISVFFPFWNEEQNIEKVVKKAIPQVRQIAKNWEIILIDDGSSDSTLVKANNLGRGNKNIRVVSHFPNRGYGAAIKEGFQNARYPIVVFMDGDDQFDFAEVKKFLGRIDSNDLVIGFREKRHDNVVRHVLMNLLKAWDFVFFGMSFKDIDCGFKMFKREAIEELLPLRSEGAMITTEILAKAKKRNLKIAEVPVSHYPRLYGSQSGANLWVVARAVLESSILWMDIRNGRF